MMLQPLCRFVAITLCGLSQFPGGAQMTLHLPASTTVRLVSPDKRWELIGPHKKVDGAYQLVLRNRIRGTQRVIHTYERDIRATWNEDGSAFYLDDAEGSNVEDTSVFFPERKSQLSLTDTIMQSKLRLPENVRKADHFYLRAVRWSSRNQLQVELCGHDDAVGFDYLLRVGIREGETRVTKVSVQRQTIGPAHLLQADCTLAASL